MKKNNMGKNNLPKGYSPSVEEVKKYIEYRKSVEYTPGREKEEALVMLFEEKYPKNNEIHEILIKCSTLNDFYSTNIFDVHSVAHHILDLNIDDRLQNGDYTLVNEIAHVEVGKPGRPKSPRFFYSFATKYCSHHFPKKYAIYDSYVVNVMHALNKRDSFSILTKRDLKEYPNFMKYINDFSQHYGLYQFNVKELDQYLWLLGKKYISDFPE